MILCRILLLFIITFSCKKNNGTFPGNVWWRNMLSASVGSCYYHRTPLSTSPTWNDFPWQGKFVRFLCFYTFSDTFTIFYKQSWNLPWTHFTLRFQFLEIKRTVSISKWARVKWILKSFLQNNAEKKCCFKPRPKINIFFYKESLLDFSR